MKESNDISLQGEPPQKIITTKGITQMKFPFHQDIPFLRKIFANSEIFPECGVHIAVYFVKDAENVNSHYSKPHSHDVDEINLVLGLENNDNLVYQIKIEDKEYEIKSPQSIYIQKGMMHSAKAISGSGFFICIVLKGSLPLGLNPTFEP